jgi:hypothetical protein
MGGTIARPWTFRHAETERLHKAFPGKSPGFCLIRAFGLADQPLSAQLIGNTSPVV